MSGGTWLVAGWGFAAKLKRSSCNYQNMPLCPPLCSIFVETTYLKLFFPNFSQVHTYLRESAEKEPFFRELRAQKP